MTSVRDRLWIWGHEANSHESRWGVPGPSRITPAEGAFYLGVPNLLMVNFGGKPVPPFDQYAVPFRPLKRVVWSIAGGGGFREGDLSGVLQLATRLPNLTGVVMDDFFRNTPEGGEIGVLSTDRLREIQSQLKGGGRKLDLWTVLYAQQLALPLGQHLALCDRVTFWTWEGREIRDLERNLKNLEAVAPASRKVLGCYMWDYGQRCPMPVDLMEMQCEMGLRWLREGRVEGMIFLASCICDLALEAVEWTREWITRVGDETI
jgi:hypothetical protein